MEGDVPEQTVTLRSDLRAHYTLPIFSLVTGRKASTLLRREFGEVTIEDLPLPYFCVSSNLATGHSDIHRRGALWQWLRASVANTRSAAPGDEQR